MHAFTANKRTLWLSVECRKMFEVAKTFHSFLLFLNIFFESPKWILLFFGRQKNFISDHFKQKPYFFSNGNHRSIKDHFIYNSETIEIINYFILYPTFCKFLPKSGFGSSHWNISRKRMKMPKPQQGCKLSESYKLIIQQFLVRILSLIISYYDSIILSFGSCENHSMILIKR